MKKNSPVSGKVIHRLTLYHGLLSDYVDKGIEFVSSPKLAYLLKVDDSQVRRDIMLCHTEGKSKIGYSVASLKKDIEKFLGLKKHKAAFIVGAGNLGFALAKYADFKDYGLEVAALFDVDAAKIGQKVGGKQVLELNKLPQMVKKMKVEIAILTVPRQVAQETATMLAEAGIKYIWNFTPTVLELPDLIQVCHENLMGDFLQFIYDI